MTSILAVIGTVVYIFVLLVLLKGENAFRNQTTITLAIFTYNVIRRDLGMEANLDLYKEMEPYENTLFRWWDWGYTRILPPDKFELIKDYIKG